jgi:KaiC/GvpD/RAD55 family RecA-like ATPase
VKIFPATDFAAQTFDKLPWAVEGLVTSNGYKLLYAASKTGKSILSAQLAFSLANGAPFLGKPVIGGPWKVLYIQVDEPEQEWAEQLKMIGCTKGWDTVIPDRFPFDSPIKYTDLQRAAKDYNFVVLDALVSLSTLDFNKPKEAALLVKKFVEFHPNLWINHHKRKESAGIPDTVVDSSAGSFVLAASASTLFNLSDNKLTARGRLVKSELNLGRDRQGLWKIKAANPEADF